MISEIYCYTWVDILDRLRSKQANDTAPNCLISAEPLPTRIILSVTFGADIGEINEWLGELFGPRFDPQRNIINLDKPINGNDRLIAVDIEQLDSGEEVDRVIKLRPSVLRGRSVVYHPTYELPAVRELSDVPPILTFHSSKGGMGRTTITLALAFALAKQGRRVLLVDSDFEAPGISALLNVTLPVPKVSFADLIALAHTDPHPSAENTVELVSERLVDQVFHSIFILPCTRDLAPPLVTPDALTVSTRRSAFFMGELLGAVAKRVGADVVLVDLRAGMSELVASLFLDPRLQHVLVTTLNGQAIDGTLHLLESLRDVAKKWTDSTGERLKNIPYVIVNQKPTDSSMIEEGDNALKSLEEKLYAKFQEIGQISTELTNEGSEENPFLDRSLAPIVIDRLSSISILPSDLEKVQERLMASDLPSKVLDAFLIDLPPTPTATVSIIQSSHGNVGLERKRAMLAEFAKESVYAENASQSRIFATRSLNKLVSSFRSELPNVVVLGDKGSGKTYTFTSVVKSKTWQNFARQVIPDFDGQVDAEIVPILVPDELHVDRKRAITEWLEEMATRDGAGSPIDHSSLGDAVGHFKAGDDALKSGAWRNFWLELIARRCGYEAKEEVSGIARLREALKNRQRRIVVVFDGLETLFQRFNSDQVEQVALESLLRQVPDWLAQTPDRSIGFVAFVREDLAKSALLMNFGQFQARYEPFALRWNWNEAAALALWIAQQAEAIPEVVAPIDLIGMDEETRAEALMPLWGWKLGSNDSKEARTLEWVMSSLSNFRTVLQARDLVRFIYISAEKSNVHDRFSEDRILTPKAIRDAIEPCSEERVKETGEENAYLEGIFRKISGMPHNLRELPWSSRDAVQRLEEPELSALLEFGIFFRREDEYFVPEIYRSGLRLYYGGGARRKVVTLMRRARAQ
ncbi:ParA family protein [Azospirillum sp. YIM B02556]|uniref:ParA family protein n=1 Tax=Azospirillum endophyticum TaxID=2800326 RepID=A0ABS1EXG8_9PROT|nr:ParA family protein [Azospirillum endophyticum]MBK1835839.1 ParA family protein [Azospirillum endophyticum]